MKCGGLNSCEHIFVEREWPRVPFPASWLEGSLLVQWRAQNMATSLPFRAKLGSEKCFCSISYRPTGLAWQGGILTSDVFCCCRIFWILHLGPSPAPYYWYLPFPLALVLLPWSIRFLSLAVFFSGKALSFWKEIFAGYFWNPQC